MTETEKNLLISAAQTISKYCRSHICTECPLNIGDKHDSIQKAHCVCDYNILHLPSTWKIEELKK
jgi:hypothetical protein